MEEKKIIKQFSAKVEASTGEDSDKFLYVKAYISTYDEDLGKDKILPGLKNYITDYIELSIHSKYVSDDIKKLFV